MRVLIFGATGMVGQGVLRECLRDPMVEFVQTIGRSETGQKNPKLKELLQADMFRLESIRTELKNFDACFFCLGVSSGGMRAVDYYHWTFELTLSAAKILAELNPDMTFTYVSGDGTDSTEQGRVAWARVKGKTENALLELFAHAFMFRPGAIEPKNGEVSKTTSYRFIYFILRPFFPLIHALLPRYITTTENLGRAMLAVAKNGYGKRILANRDINLLGAQAG